MSAKQNGERFFRVIKVVVLAIVVLGFAFLRIARWEATPLPSPRVFLHGFTGSLKAVFGGKVIMSIDGLKRTIHILAGLLLSASISVPALAVSAKQDARSYPSDFRHGVMLDYIYTQQLEAPYSSVWGGTEIERAGYRRTVYVETHEKSVFAGLVEFECRALGFVTIREWDLEMGVPADLTGARANGGEAIGGDREWFASDWDGSCLLYTSDAADDVSTV